MIFGKTKTPADRPVEQETLKRWRAAAGQQQDQEAAPGDWTVADAPEQPDREKTDEATPTFLRPEQAVVGRAPVSDPSLSVEDDLQRRFGSKVRAALGPGAVIQGKLSFDSPVRIDGTLVGEVTASSTLIVGEQGTVEAQIKVGNLIVLGYVTGNVEAEDLVEIKAGGRLVGDIRTRRIVVEDGGIFEGRCSQGKAGESQLSLVPGKAAGR